MRHHHIGKQQIDSAGVVFSERNRVTAVGRLQHRIAQPLQELADHPAQVRLVFRHDDRFLSRLRWFQRKLRQREFRGPRNARKIDAERGTAPQLAAHANVPARGAHDVV